MTSLACRCIRVTFAIFVLSLCSPAAAAQSAKEKLKFASEDDIREAVLRYQMEGWTTNADAGEREATDKTDKEIAARLNFHVFFISINEKDPSDSFMERFKDFHRTVKKASFSKVEGWRNTVVDKSTGEAGIIFNADKVLWRGPDSVEVEGGYFCDGLCASGETFKLRRKHGKWIVTGTKMHWIS